MNLLKSLLCDDLFTSTLLHLEKDSKRKEFVLPNKKTKSIPKSNTAPKSNPPSKVSSKKSIKPSNPVVTSIEDVLFSKSEIPSAVSSLIPPSISILEEVETKNPTISKPRLSQRKKDKPLTSGEVQNITRAVLEHLFDTENRNEITYNELAIKLMQGLNFRGYKRKSKTFR